MAYIQPRTNKDGKITSYTIKVHKGRDPLTGKQLKPYIMSWKPPEGKSEKQVEKELNKAAVLFEEQCSHGIPTSTIKLADFCPKYLEIVEATISPTTMQFYKSQIDKYIIPSLGHLKLKEIKTAHVQGYVKELTSLTNKDGAPISAATVRRYLTVLQSVLTQAVKLDLIADTPAKTEKLSLPKVVEQKIEIFTKQQAAEMLNCLEQEDLQFQVLVQLAIHTGARRGELVSLRFSDIDYETAKLTIERAAIKVKDEEVQIKAPKDYEIRMVSLNQACLDLITLLKKEKESQARRLGDKWVEGDWLFTQCNGEIIHPHSPTKQFSKFLKRHGLPHRKLHSLRHTSATLLLYGGANIKQVQGRLGHGDIETTNKYLKYIEEADVESSNILDTMLNSGNKKNVPKQGT